VKVLTESEMNSIAAKIVKAEIMGNDDLAAQLKTKLESAKAARADMIAKGMNPDEPPETVVKLKGEDVRQKRKKTKVETHNKGGERVRYFGDDDRYDLKQLFEREKMNTAEDQQGMLSKYRKALVKMFLSQGEDCVFMETAMGFKRHPHMIIECIPVPEDMGAMLPMYYQKAIQECETEWTNNVKLVKLKDRNIARSVPKGLPYFHVDFGLDNGFAHVIEEEENWNRRFGHEVVGGMLDVEARTMRNPPHEQFEQQKAKVIQFGEMWAKFDWTRMYKKGNQGSDSDSD